MFGYKPKATGLATVMVDVYQQVPRKLVNGVAEPDYDYAVYVNANTTVSTSTGKLILNYICYLQRHSKLPSSYQEQTSFIFREVVCL